ncbi:Protein of unknown function DUF262 [Abditibacterium utsteinense]|uniref:GmrSD restriction endonucleases N-terminal domain-containing protein n=1 Tax=Abditibacterium utsteinense TaxID=1960156 RepID=A0A2S8SV59_9BACT|nr:DUF262 domain-containing protein [Abditibacterium utsteinense]PQV64685.1 Protein of unknown function DUF262 [Abditibacterium utsteinense]
MANRKNPSQSPTSTSSPSKNVRADSVTLQRIIDERMGETRVASNSLSFNEMLNMYRDGELVIQPEFQRTFRWSTEQQSRFIESLILELPIPALFFVELENGQAELVDGLQRISTYLHFRGFLPEKWASQNKDRVLSRYDDEDGSLASSLPTDDDRFSLDASDPSLQTPSVPTNFLHLSGCEIVPELNGLTYPELPTAAQIALKRYYAPVYTVRKASRPDLKFHMFKRLNQGGSPLSNQELRNCYVRVVNDALISFINRCSRQDNFWSCVRSISAFAAEELYHQELVLRFFAFKNNRQEYVHDISPFLDSYLEQSSGVLEGHRLAFDQEVEKRQFDLTFDWLSQTTGADTFRAMSAKTRNVSSGFRSLLFEAITLGIQEVLPYLDANSSDHKMRFEQTLTNLKVESEFHLLTTGGGKNYANEFNKRIGYVESAMEKAFPEFKLKSLSRALIKTFKSSTKGVKKSGAS